MSLNDVISQYEEELMVFDIVKNNVDVLIDVGCRENYDYAQIKPEAKMYLFDVNEIFIKNLNEKIKDKNYNIRVRSTTLRLIADKLEEEL